MPLYYPCKLFITFIIFSSGLLALNTPVVNTHPAGNTQTFIPNGSGEHQPIDDIQSAIAVATSELGLLPGVAFQARVSQLAQLTDTHQTVGGLLH